MSSERLKAQAFPAKILENHIRLCRLAGGYLFTGEDAGDLREMALAFAGAVFSGAGLEEDSEAKRRVRAGIHPDTHWLGADPDQRSLKIEEIRQILRWAAYKPFEAPYKFFVLEGAERLTVEAQNALLKILEEPPPQTVFCLLAQNKERLLETIRSRVFEIKFRPRSGTSVFPDRLEDLTRDWQDLLEAAQTEPREKARERIRRTREALRVHLEARAGEIGTAVLGPWLAAVDALDRAAQALESNANQKLAMTWLGLALRKQQDGLKAETK